MTFDVFDELKHLSGIFVKTAGEQPIMAGRRAQEPETKEESPEDRFIRLVQESLEAALKLPADPKEKNGLFANCIKFIAVKNKLKGEEGSFFDD